jgi:hypothetical protein
MPSRGNSKASASLVDEMRELITGGKAKSAREAAEKVAAKAAGNGTIDSKVDRLRKTYSEIFD